MAVKSLKSASSFRLLLLFAFFITLTCGLIYVTVHQNFRQSANDPQIQLAEDTVSKLEAKQTLQWGEPIDISKSLAPFVVIYDESGNPVSGNGQLNGKPAVPPKGVFDYTREHGQDRITWQPQADTRVAIVVEHYNGGYVLAGRSLREVERREQMLTQEVGGAWIVGMLGALVLVTIL